MKNGDVIWDLVDSKRSAFEALSDRVWAMPEIAYTEYESCAEHTSMLRAQGFNITECVAGIPTAVMGEAGEGGPVIAILGEYDALALPSRARSQALGMVMAVVTICLVLPHFLQLLPSRIGWRQQVHEVACAIMAVQRRKGAPLRRSWCAQALLTMLILPFRGIRHRSRKWTTRNRLPIRAWILSLPAGPLTPPPHRIWGVLPSMRWS